MPTRREIDENGFLTVRGNPISSFGIFDYSAGQVGLPGDPMRIVKVYRPESAINNPDTIESFKDVPFIIEHAMLSGDNLDAQDEQAGIVNPEDKGMDGVLTGNVYYDSPWLRGDLRVFTRKGRKAIEDGIVDLSLGFGCKFRHSPGKFDGQDYEVVQTDMRGNHIALVPEGRVAGARVLDARVFDSKNGEGGVCTVIIEERITLEGETMKTKRTPAMDNAVQQLLGLIPALKEFLQQEATEPAHQEGAEGQANQNGENVAESGDAFGAAGEAAGGEGAGVEGAPDLGNLISQIEDCLGQLRTMAGQGATGQDGNEEGQSGAGADAVEGLQEKGSNHAPVGDEGAVSENDNGGKASAGPAAGINAKAGDAAVRAVYADFAAKARIYDGLSEVVGAFDHSAMDARQVAAYGVKKLGIKGVSPGQEITAIDLYLKGRSDHAKNTKQSTSAQVGDAKANGSFVAAAIGTGDAKLDAYISGKK